MKTKILEGLRAKFPGVKDSVLSRIAEKLAETVTTEEAVTTSVEGVTFQQVLESYGDSRATEATQTSVTNYEKKHGLKDGKPVEDPNKGKEPKKTEDEMPAWAKALVEQNENLSKQLQAINGDKLAKARKDKLDAIIKDAPEAVKTLVAGGIKPEAFATEEEYDAHLATIKTQVETLSTQLQAKGGVFKSPPGGGGGGGEKPSQEVEARIKEREAEAAAPAIQGLPK